jgi:hypothetical protein
VFKILGKTAYISRHSWNRLDNLKTTKNNEDRRVEVPFPGLIQDLMQVAKTNPHGCNMDSYLFWGEVLNTKPMEAKLFLYDLRCAMKPVGMSKETTYSYSFHGGGISTRPTCGRRWMRSCSRSRPGIRP